jgi:hypothetical protein
VNTIMKILKTKFRKNGLDYTLMKRNDKIALFQLGPTEYPDGQLNFKIICLTIIYQIID